MIAVLSILLAGPWAWAAPTTADQAAAVVRGCWKRGARPTNTPQGNAVGRVETFNDEQNQPAYHIVYVTTDGTPTGFVIVSADDDVEPIIGFVCGGTYDPSPGNPLGALVAQDLPARVKAARAAASQPASPVGPAGNRPSTILLRGKKIPATPKARWRQLAAGGVSAGEPTSPMTGGPPFHDGVPLPDGFDICVPVLVQSRWNQGSVDGDYCYNYYTPNHHVCGCVATAMAQVLRYWEHQPEDGIGVHGFAITIDGGDPETWYTKGGDEAGGPYEWDKMPLDPVHPDPNQPGVPLPLTIDQRKAIGALCYDAGVVSGLDYALGWTGGFPDAGGLRNTFGYRNAIPGPPAMPWNPMFNPSLDAESPCLLHIHGSKGHEVVVDGYGYYHGTLYHHMNFGNSGAYEVAYDAWYNLPYLYGTGFTSLWGCIYNIFPADADEIISGRVLDMDGQPINGVVVTAERVGGNPSYTGTAISYVRGVYALKNVPRNGTYRLTVDYPDYSSCSLEVEVGVSTDGQYPVQGEDSCGNVWGADFPPSVPPRAEDGAAVTQAGVPATVGLRASDDGQPVPAALTYVITSLPSHGSLSDPSAGAIDNVPYTLANGGSEVVYTPIAKFLGSDGFTFKANDGGSAPFGGDSDPASIDITVGFHAADMDTNPSWTLDTGWVWMIPTPALWTYYGGPPGAKSGAYVLCNTRDNTQATRRATTTAIDCRGYTNVRLCFWRWLAFGWYATPTASIQVSKDSINWYTIWDSIEDEQPQAVQDTEWTFQDIDIPSTEASNQEHVYIRWSITPSIGTNGRTDPCWSIDDVVIIGDPIPLGEPTNPSPADSQTNVPLNPVLSWTPGTTENPLPVTYDVYLGTTNPPTTLLAGDLSSPTCSAGFLQETSTYYWKVVAKTANTEIAGPVWQFTTALPVHNLTQDTYHATIQAAIDAAEDDNVIEVSPGTYHEQINSSGKNITVQSTFLNYPVAMQPTIIAATTIDGGGVGTVPEAGQ